MILPTVKSFVVLCEDWGATESDFWITIQVDIGPCDLIGSETFTFSIVGIDRLRKILVSSNIEIGRGIFIQNVYNLQEVRNVLDNLLSNCQAYEWKEVSMRIARYLKGEIG